VSYNAEIFAQIRSSGLKQGCPVLSLGSQTVYIGSQKDIALIDRFIEFFGGKPLRQQAEIPAAIDPRSIFERAGFQYCSTGPDVEGYINLSKLVFPRELRDRFGLVLNIGFSEHFANPVACLAFMHYAARVGGVLYHDLPLFGWGNHGLVSMTPKFWHALIWMNGYERISTSVSRVVESAVEPGNFYHGYLRYLHGLEQARDISWMVRAILRKTNGDVFLPPYDAVLPTSDGGKEAALLHGALEPFVNAGVWTDEEVCASIDRFMQVLNKPYRMQSPDRSLRQQQQDS
jgi:hypothetical protein